MASDYVRINKMPSRFMPYDVNYLELRKLTLGEVDYISSNKHDPMGILHYLREIEIVRNIDFFELTKDDYAFIELTLSAMSFPNAHFDIDNGNCPECGDQVEHIEFDLGDGKVQSVEQRGKMRALVLPKDVVFNELKENVEHPMEIKLMSGEIIPIDFFRLKHLDILNQEGLYAPVKFSNPPTEEEIAAEIERDRKYTIRRNELITNRPYSTLDVGDNLIIDHAYEYLRHNVLMDFDLKCSVCAHKHTIHTSWQVTSFIPFREHDDSPRDRIRFGRRDAPTDRAAKTARISSRPVASPESS